jgi:hypothetical protein
MKSMSRVWGARAAGVSRFGALCVSLVLFANCEKVQKNGELSGSYRLISVDGKNVPAVVTHEGAKLEIRSGSLTFNKGRTCVSKMIFVPPSGTEGVREVSATYSQKGSKLDMQWKGAGKTTGTLQGATFTMNNEGMMFVFGK